MFTPAPKTSSEDDHLSASDIIDTPIKAMRSALIKLSLKIAGGASRILPRLSTYPTFLFRVIRQSLDTVSNTV
jgi:hypothetical protein